MATVETLLTLEEFAGLPDDGVPRELVRGSIVEMNVPTPRHGYVCQQVARIIGNHVKSQHLGRVVSNNGGIVVGREPDTIRGADVSFYSFARLPRVIQ